MACLRAATRAGLSGRIVPRPDLASISPLTLPCILLLKDDRSCVLTALGGDDGDSATVILFEHGECEQQTTRAALLEEYTGYVLFGAVEAKVDTTISVDLKGVNDDPYFTDSSITTIEMDRVFLWEQNVGQVGTVLAEDIDNTSLAEGGTELTLFRVKLP